MKNQDRSATQIIADLRIDPNSEFSTENFSIKWGVIAEKYCFVLNEKGSPGKEISKDVAIALIEKEISK